MAPLLLLIVESSTWESCPTISSYMLTWKPKRWSSVGKLQTLSFTIISYREEKYRL